MSVVDISWSQPSLELGPRPALRLLLEILLDPETESAVISIEARTFPERTLVALSSRPGVHFGDVEAAMREAGREFTELLREHTGPFS